MDPQTITATVRKDRRMPGAVGVCPPPATAPFEDMFGIIEGTVGDDVLVRFGEVACPLLKLFRIGLISIRVGRRATPAPAEADDAQLLQPPGRWDASRLPG